ncbi:methyl-accepting chemotaxis protein [uncultured Clostridium sp.]|uniref:methyl-accepting chemotaxis protein n=1 Tax=uncultured Clostridium sp. TaxID=59620 RepID=UPI0028E38CB9|nr:methyl-accepting chemotaxis protein [uncultured Clostridium sp.]
MFKELQKGIDINQQAAEQANLDKITQFNNVRYSIITYMAIAFLVIVLMAYILTKNIMYPLNNIKELAGRLSRYDFSKAITITRKDEFGQTGTALNMAQENVSNLVKLIMENSQEISASTQEVYSSINMLSSKAMEGSNNANNSKERAAEVKNNSKKAINETRKIYVEKQEKMKKAIEFTIAYK